MGPLQTGCVLIIGDHASNHVPDTVDLGVERALLNQHIAWDIAVADVAAQLVKDFSFSALLATYSRLVVDLNRDLHEAGVIPVQSDGIHIPGNAVSAEERDKRIALYYRPYHDQLASLITRIKPSLLLSLHSFTPSLRAKPDEVRPWEIGVLYNQDDLAALMAIPYLQQAGLVVGDQLPYSGKVLNATMNRHGEANGVPYLGIEMRQDAVGDPAGQARFAAILGSLCADIVEKLALAALN
jgi:predicted N-formylglutamate amidohydrolase